MDIDEAVAIIEAYLTGRYTSIYLMDAWHRIKQEVKENERENY